LLLGSIKCQLPDEFMGRISRLADQTDVIVPKVLEAGGQVVLEQVRSGLRSVLSGESTGELERSLGLTPARLDRKGDYNVKVGFDEPRSDGKSNAMLANVLEFGKHGQPPRPFLKAAKAAARGPATAAMVAALDSEVAKL
jgi:HK97 gp10 family phage protein